MSKALRILVFAVIALAACDDYHVYTITGRVLDPDGGGVGGISLGCRLNQASAGTGYMDAWHPITQGARCMATQDAGCPEATDAAGVGDFTCKVDTLNVNSTAPQQLVLWANQADAGNADVRYGFVMVTTTVPDQGTTTQDVVLPLVQ
jgi:hypothetical protein